LTKYQKLQTTKKCKVHLQLDLFLELRMKIVKNTDQAIGISKIKMNFQLKYLKIINRQKVKWLIWNYSWLQKEMKINLKLTWINNKKDYKIWLIKLNLAVLWNRSIKLFQIEFFRKKISFLVLQKVIFLINNQLILKAKKKVKKWLSLWKFKRKMNWLKMVK
jgi:hypothetical protein